MASPKDEGERQHCDVLLEALIFFFIDGTKQVKTNDCSHVSLPMCNPMLFSEVKDKEYFYILYLLVV